MFRTRLYREQHGRIRALARPLQSQGGSELSAAELRAALAKLAGAVKVHLRDEDANFYPVLSVSDDVDVRDTAIAFRTSMGGLAAAFNSFYERWVKPGAIEADRAGFLGDANIVLTQLAQRMDLEDRELYELADRHATHRNPHAG